MDIFIKKKKKLMSGGIMKIFAYNSDYNNMLSLFIIIVLN
jgi:hypothetical protein